MPAALTGSVRLRNGRWMASVPRLSDPKKRVERSFATEAAAEQWRDAQLDRRARGLEPLARQARRSRQSPEVRSAKGTRTAGPRRPRFADIAFSWHHQYYEELENAGAERSKEVRFQLERHLIPSFAGLLDCDLETGRSMVKDWLRTLSGRRPHTPGSPLSPGPKIYARHSANGMLWVLRQVLDHARMLGHEVPPYTEGKGVHALHPVGPLCVNLV